MSRKKITLIILVIYMFSSCKKGDVQEEESLKKDVIITTNDSIRQLGEFVKDILYDAKKRDSIVTDLIVEEGVVSDSLLHITTETSNYRINDYVLFFNYSYSDEINEREDLSIPYLINHKGVHYNIEQYPEKFHVRLVPNVIDTLVMISGGADCYSCLGITSIQGQKGDEFYYKIEIDDKVIAQDGQLGSVLTDRGLSMEELNDSDRIIFTIDDWKDAYFSSQLTSNYTFSPDLILRPKTSIEKVRQRILSDEDLQTDSFDTLKLIYENYLISEDVIKFDNLLTQVNDEEYDHSGGFSKKIESDVMLFIDSINIIYISEKNELHKIEWINDYTDIIDDSEAPFDDNIIKLENGGFKINQWGVNNLEIDLFHPMMKSGRYLVVYAVKLKNLDTYIYSPIETIDYKKPY